MRNEDLEVLKSRETEVVSNLLDQFEQIDGDTSTKCNHERLRVKTGSYGG